MNFLLFLILALFHSAAALYAICRYAPVRDNPAKWGPEIRVLGIIIPALGLGSFPRSGDNLWLKAFDCYLTLICVEYILLFGVGTVAIQGILGVRHVHVALVGPNLFGFSDQQYRRLMTASRKRSARGLEDNSKSFEAFISRRITAFSGAITRNGGRPLIGWLINNLLWTSGHATKSRCAMATLFARIVHHRWKAEGMKGLVFFLKTSYVLIQQAVAGYKVSDLTPLKRRVRRARSGLPKWIPLQQRILIMKGDIPTIRWWTSLCSIYRVLSFPSIVSVSSIIDPGIKWETLKSFTQSSLSWLKEVINLFWSKRDIESLRKKWNEKSIRFFPISKSSPVTNLSWERTDWWSEKGAPVPISTTPEMIGASAFALMCSGNLLPAMAGLIADRIDRINFLHALRKIGSVVCNPFPGYAEAHPEVLSFPTGKLGLKDEPAGKVRVFAMVDPWTQWLLHPLHRMISELLRPIKEDATFDQIGRVEEKLKEIQDRGGTKAFSFDLSSATDRLPVNLQMMILTPLLGVEGAQCWATLLTDRDYLLPQRAQEDTGLKSVRYRVGQPMGAYSSWVMLALTHHVIVQWAAFLSKSMPYTRWFSDYIVLGDDIVIFDSAVASQYYDLMTRVLGVGIGLAKSIKSRKALTFEFAKKLWIRGERCFVVPIRDIIVTQLTTEPMLEFMKKHDASFMDYLRIRGIGYKSRSKWMGRIWKLPGRLRCYVVYYQYHQLEFWSWVRMISVNSFHPETRLGFIRMFELIVEDLGRLLSKIEVPKSSYLAPNSWIGDPRTLLSERRQRYDFYFNSETGLDQFLDKALDLRVYLDKVHVSIKNQEYNFLRFKDEWPLETLKQVCTDLVLLYDEIEDYMEKYETTTIFTWSRKEDRVFSDLRSLFKKWIRYNAAFAPAKKEFRSVYTREPLPKLSTKPLTTLDDLLGEVFDEYGNTRDMELQPRSEISERNAVLHSPENVALLEEFISSQRKPLRVIPSNVEVNPPKKGVSIDWKGIWSSFWLGFLGAGMILILWESWSSPEPQPGISTWPESSGPTSPGASVGLVDIWLSMFLGAFLMIFLLGLGLTVWDGSEWLSFKELLVDMWSWRGEEVAITSVPQETTTFRFPSYRELVEWQESSRAPGIVRSPQIGHGWSEPWSVNQDWPEAWR